MATPHRVVATGLARAQLLALASSSFYDGRQQELTRAMRQIGQLLAHAPRSVGGPLYFLKAAKLRVRSMTHSSLYIEHGVHESEPLVIIRFVTSFRGQVD